MPRRVKLGHHYYYVLTPHELRDGNFRGKNVVTEGIVDDKPLVEFYTLESPNWRATFHVDGLMVEFPGNPCVGKGDWVKVYGRFLGDCIKANALETEKALFVTEE